MNRTWILIAGFVASIAITSCSTKVFFEKSPSADFSKFRTYAFLPRVDSATNSLFANDIVDEIIQKNITIEMQKRNFTIDVKNPDLMIRFHVVVGRKLNHTITHHHSFTLLYGLDTLCDILISFIQGRFITRWALIVTRRERQ